MTRTPGSPPKRATGSVWKETEAGVLADGTPWLDGARNEGRSCNVFEFRGPLISRLYIYADPDFAGRHEVFQPDEH